MKKNNYKDFFKIKNISLLFFLLMFFVFDRYFKSLAIGLEKDIPLVKNVLNFTFFANKNISFSLPFSGFWLLIIISILTLFIIYFSINVFKRKQWPEFFSWLAIALGSISNLIDRFRFSFVVDYFDLIYFSVFNLADVLITVGCLYIILSNLLHKEVRIQ